MLWLIKVLSPRIAILMLLYVHTTVKQLSKKNVRWWKPELLLLEWEFINKRGKGLGLSMWQWINLETSV